MPIGTRVPAGRGVLLAAAACAAFQLPAQAADSQPVLEEILVTATRRGDVDVQTTPVAVTALSAEDVARMVPRDLGDIAIAVPNFSAGKPPGFNAASFAMRGVGQTSIIVYADAHVGVTVDDFVVPHIQTQALEMFDIEQVEVLRGPQGTLFGKNTTGGVINVRTKRPQLQETSAEVQAKFAKFNRREQRFAINLPVGDTFAMRAAGARLRSDGYYRNGASYGPVDPNGLFPANPLTGTSGTGNGSREGGDDVFSGRFKALWQPSDTFAAMFTYEIIRDRGDSPPTVNTTPAGDARLTWNLLGLTQDPERDRLTHAAITNRDDLLLNMTDGHQVEVNGYYLNLEWDVGAFTINSVTGYREQDSELPNTYTGEVGPNSLFDANRSDERETFQQEVRVSSNFDGPVNFVAGGFVQNDETTFCVLQVLGFLDLLGLGQSFFGDPTFFNNNPQILCNEQDASNWALFGEATWNLTDRFSVGAGFRYTHEEKDWRGRNQVFIQALDGGFDPNLNANTLGSILDAANFKRFPTGVVSNSNSWNEPTWRFTLGYDASDAVYTYFTYSRGFKSGAYNDQTGTTGQPILPANAAPTDPEKADSFEAGVKLDLFDSRLRLDAIGFYVTYEDAQRDLVAQFQNSFGQTFQETRFFNAAEVTAAGIELEATALVTANLMLKANLGWLDTEYDSFEADTDFDGVTDIDLSGRPVNRAPEWQFSVDAIYTHQWLTGELSWAVNVNYEDESVFVYSNVDPAFDGTTDKRTLVNASVTYTDAEDRYFMRLYAKNISNELYRVGELPVADLWTFAYYGQPRTFGAEFGAKFRRN